MKRKLLNISGKLDRATIAIYELIESVAKSKKIAFFIIGATARDLVLHYGYGIKIQRATRDIDLAIHVSTWDKFEELKTGLLETGKFETTKRIERLINKKYNIPVDIVPFGSIKDKEGKISWPPEHAIQLNILGFDDAYKDAMPVRLRAKPKLDVMVAAPPSLAALKLIAWNERAPENTRDAPDLLYIARNYLDIGNHDRLQNKHADLVNDDNFDYVLTGARLLGRDMATILSKKTVKALTKILAEQTEEDDKYPLVEDMARRGSRTIFEENLSILCSIKQGILDRTKK